MSPEIYSKVYDKTSPDLQRKRLRQAQCTGTAKLRRLELKSKRLSKDA